MTISCILGANEYGEHWWIVFNDDKQFVEIKTPAWARRVAESVHEGSFVTMGRRPDDTWDVVSIQSPKGVSEDDAKAIAVTILEKLRKRNMTEACKLELEKRGRRERT